MRIVSEWLAGRSEEIYRYCVQDRTAECVIVRAYIRSISNTETSSCSDTLGKQGKAGTYTQWVSLNDRRYLDDRDE